MNRTSAAHTLLIDYRASRERFLSYEGLFNMFWPSVVLKRQELSLQENREDKVSLTSDLIWAGQKSGRAPDHASVHTTTRLPAYAHVTGQVPDSEHLTEPTTKEPTIEEVTLPLLVLSTGLHGIEGYVGSTAMFVHFIIHPKYRIRPGRMIRFDCMIRLIRSIHHKSHRLNRRLISCSSTASTPGAC